MAEFSRVLPFTLQAEGGYCDDPQDPGRVTNFGITAATLSDWRGRPCSAGDVRALTRTEAERIYTAKFWAVVRGDQLPPGFDLMVFDFGVNAGPERSIRLLQRIVGTTADGVMGPQTIARAACSLSTVRTRLALLSNLHEAYYLGLPGYGHDGRGWTARVNACLSTALSLACGLQTAVVPPALPKPQRLTEPAA